MLPQCSLELSKLSPGFLSEFVVSPVLATRTHVKVCLLSVSDFVLPLLFQVPDVFTGFSSDDVSEELETCANNLAFVTLLTQENLTVVRSWSPVRTSLRLLDCSPLIPDLYKDDAVYKAHHKAMKKGNVVVNCSLLDAFKVLDKQAWVEKAQRSDG